ncbi:hypothetical protein [uncultured Helicobacter sp.]|uniref:hypothetical protein n=1 Tax=uncultured Helicobacter sp. TaxID=175537 RepID=UPI002639A97C|nr:hypothetical protein [uncultured Helicobacter sp.]
MSKIKNQIKIGNNNKIKNSNFGIHTESKSKNESMLKQILVGVVVAVIGGVLVWWITK